MPNHHPLSLRFFFAIPLLSLSSRDLLMELFPLQHLHFFHQCIPLHASLLSSLVLHTNYLTLPMRTLLTSPEKMMRDLHLHLLPSNIHPALNLQHHDDSYKHSLLFSSTCQQYDCQYPYCSMITPPLLTYNFFTRKPSPYPHSFPFTSIFLSHKP